MLQLTGPPALSAFRIVKLLERLRRLEPAIAFAMPPPGSPTGFGVCVRKARLIDPMPR